MNGKIRKVLGGMSTAGLILAGSLPLLGGNDAPAKSCRGKTKQTDSAKGAAAKKKLDKSTPEKTAPAKEKAAK